MKPGRVVPAGVIVSDHIAESIQPIVLVGGASRRFGRDKLREPIRQDHRGGVFLVEHPISVLREVFGPIVAVVGACHESVRQRADRIIPDPYPGVGPVGGILAALEHAGSAVFVLAGDLSRIDDQTVRRILAVATDSPASWAVLGRGSRPEPCIGLYRRPMRELLRDRMGRGVYRLHDAVPTDRLAMVPINPSATANVNRPEDIAGGDDAVL
jgi:molybdopterin-guanine dinucleotide biosynthesis protein A